MVLALESLGVDVFGLLGILPAATEVQVSWLKSPKLTLDQGGADDILFNASFDRMILRAALAYMLLRDNNQEGFIALTQEVRQKLQLSIAIKGQLEG